jgi:hypothetical protein
MIYLYNIFGVFLVFIWNAAVMAGTLWLILEKDWSPWTLVVTLLFFSRWKEWTLKQPEEPKEETPRIIV